MYISVIFYKNLASYYVFGNILISCCPFSKLLNRWSDIYVYCIYTYIYIYIYAYMYIYIC